MTTKKLQKRGVNYYSRPKYLASENSTNVEFVADFLGNVDCNHVFEIHSITESSGISSFAQFVHENEFDSFLSLVEERLECVY